MRPRVFLSSTIRDLCHVRDALRDTIIILGYEPVMSEHGEVGYLPSITAEESCYVSLDDCDVLVAVIGRRYGSIGKDSKSITHNEVIRARELGIPVYCFIERDVATQLRVLAANPDARLSDFEAPQALLEFVNEVVKADRNNSIIEFSSVPDAQSRLRLQLASLFRHLLRQKNDLVRRSLSDLLAEVRAIRYKLPPETTEQSAALLTALKFFGDDLESHGQTVLWHYRRLALSVIRGLEQAVPRLLAAPSFKEFLVSTGVHLEVMTFAEARERQHPWPFTGQVLAACNGPLLGPGSTTDLHYVLYPNLEMQIDDRVLRALEQVHFDLKRLYTETVRDALNAVQSSADSLLLGATS